jgi:hypothetical protein
MIEPIVVIKAFDKFKVGTVMDVTNSGSVKLYQVKTEDGRVYDDVKVNDFKSLVYIHKSITNSFLKNKK